jgi:hypothetical protein
LEDLEAGRESEEHAGVERQRLVAGRDQQRVRAAGALEVEWVSGELDLVGRLGDPW